MLLRLRGTTQQIDQYTFKLLFDIPVLYLENTNYNISLRMIFCDCNFTDNYPTSQFWSLQTTAVDKSSFNPTQEICSFAASFSPNPVAPEPDTSGSDYTYVYYEPMIKRDYKMQITSVHSADFFLALLKPDPALEIPFVEILLEFSRYARI